MSTMFSITFEPTASAQDGSIPQCFKPASNELPQLPPMVKTMSPLRRTTEAEEVADAISFLHSPSTTSVNGVAPTDDAGMTLLVERI